MKNILFSLLLIPSHFISSGQKQNDSLAVEFDIHYNWFISSKDSCKNIRLEVLNWTKNDDSSIYIFNNRDTFYKKPDHYKLKETGEHHVKIISFGKSGKEYIYENKLIVECDTNLSFTVSSWNGCGSHTEFSFHTDSTLSDQKLIVFDRWGELIFESVELPVKWEGQVNKRNNFGSEARCASGHYPYIFFFKDRNNINRYFLSHFTIIR